MSYPEAISYTVSCPGQNSTNTGIPLPCNMSAPVFKSSLTRWNTTQPPPITPRPVVEPVEEKPVLAPTQDCTTLSFARPDVILEGGALYTPNSPGGSLTDTYLNFTITNRATGVHHFCRWGGNHTQLESGSWLRLLCALPPGSLPDPTSTSFSIVFVPNERRLRITQDWACGSTDGSYTRKYQSFVTHVPPFVCPSSPGGQATTCVANRQYIKAQLQRPVQWSPDLIPPPASALHPGCTGNSQIPSWVIHKFRYEDERAIFWFAEDPNPLPPISQWPFGPYYPWDPSRTITLEIRNQANNNLQTCQLRSFSRTETDAQFARRWHRCHPDTGNSIHYIETYVQFDPSTANFRVNETWFCGDTDPSKPILYTSLAATKIPTCGTSTTEITRCPEWERGPQFTPNCSWHYHTRFCQTGKFESGQSGPIIVPADHFFSSSPEQTQTRLLPSNALTDPDPNPDLWSCTSDSLGRPITWTLNETPDHLGFADFFSTQLSWGTDISDPRSTLDFEFVNSALQKRDSGEGGKNKIMLWTSSNLTPYTPLWRPDLKYGLFVKEYSSSLVVQGHGRKPFREFLDWNLKFDASRGYFEIEHAWVCGELNGGRPILFNGTWAGYLNVTCDFTEAERRDEARVVCRLAGGSAVLKPKVTWEVRPGLVIT
ncbi:hypothetical protein QBC44DRAFT_320892 [Cladorrhinum sp. PSN332]|nr:hypothetical protein QBC44DRAFT_320892 [Cladorrhinum sp. PSN332]